MVKIGIIGFGNMGSAIYQRLSEHSVWQDVYVVDRNPSKLLGVAQDRGAVDVHRLVELVDILILAVKPQAFEALAAMLKGRLASKTTLSIMAGISIDTLEKALGTTQVVRVMPNLPLKVGKGLTAWMASPSLRNKAQVRDILKSFGEEIEVDTEEKIDLLTALSGSGPAYFFYLCELLAQKAVDLGFSPQDAKKIAEATFIGSAELLERGDQSAQELRMAVTSKAGTTEVAIQYLKQHRFDEIFWEAVNKAQLRAKELAKINT
jgi:pyrroline-5-carboxylate reductase